MKQQYLPRLTIKIILILNPHKIQNETTITKGINSTYSHVVKLIDKMEAQGLITTIRFGRTKNVNLTMKGIIVQGLLRELEEALK